MSKVFCYDCQTEVLEADTTVIGQETICLECIRLDVEDYDLSELFDSEEQIVTNELLH